MNSPYNLPTYKESAHSIPTIVIGKQRITLSYFWEMHAPNGRIANIKQFFHTIKLSNLISLTNSLLYLLEVYFLT